MKKISIYTLSYNSHIISIILILAWVFGAIYEYNKSGQSFSFWILILLAAISALRYIHFLSLTKPLMYLTPEGIELRYKQYQGQSVSWHNIKMIKLISSPADLEGAGFSHHLIIYARDDVDADKEIKIPLGFSKYARQFDVRKIERIKNKFEKFPVKLTGFDQDIDTQNNNYLTKDDDANI